MVNYPHNTEAERAVIGCLLMGGDDPRLHEDMFHIEGHRLLFQTIRDMQKNGMSVDSVSVAHEATKRGIPMVVVTIRDCIESVAVVEHVDTYTNILIECFERRQMVDFAIWLYRKSQNPLAEVSEVWRQAGAAMDRKRKVGHV